LKADSTLTTGRLVAFQTWEVEAYFQILCRRLQDGLLSFNQFCKELNAIRVYDRAGSLWTIGAKSGKWYRLNGQNWTLGAPEGLLFSANQVNAKLSARNTVCPKCQKPVERRFRYCPYCGAETAQAEPATAMTQPTEKQAVSAPIFCRYCGKSMSATARFCNNCGRPRR
jgi:RNA polymerase subunit RPABC4/transcription elongation factor Spt4